MTVEVTGFLLLSAISGFALAWFIRANAASATEGSALARLQSLQEQNARASEELRDLKKSHAELMLKHLSESNARAAAEATAACVPGLTERLEHAGEQVSVHTARIATLETELANERSAIQEQRELLEQSRAVFSESFKALSADALNNNNQAFLVLAKSTLEKFQEGARGDLDARQKAVDQLVQPLKDSLTKVDSKLGEIEKERVSAYSSLNEQLKGLVETHLPVLRNETAKLVKALRQPAARGRWGEVQLKRVVEMAGMLEHCDFVEQQSRTTEEGRLRPDLVVKLPGGRHIVVDAKAPISAYLEATEAANEPTQRSLLAQHAQQCRNHITALGRKAYWEQFAPTPEFVVMFIPGEVFFSAALQEDATLLECGVSEKVIPATPTTLIALLRAVAYGWRQEKLAQSAEDVAKLGKEIYERLCTLGGHWNEVGERLGKAVEAYNRSTTSLDSRVMVSARRFRDLKVGADNSEIGLPKQIEVIPRVVQAEELSLGQFVVNTGTANPGAAAA